MAEFLTSRPGKSAVIEALLALFAVASRCNDVLRGRVTSMVPLFDWNWYVPLGSTEPLKVMEPPLLLNVTGPLRVSCVAMIAPELFARREDPNKVLCVTLIVPLLEDNTT